MFMYETKTTWNKSYTVYFSQYSLQETALLNPKQHSSKWQMQQKSYLLVVDLNNIFTDFENFGTSKVKLTVQTDGFTKTQKDLNHLPPIQTQNNKNKQIKWYKFIIWIENFR